jgi:GNAT superfamily N-acetyltransferase
MGTDQSPDVKIRPMTRGDIRAVMSLDREIAKARGAASSLSYRDLVAADPGGPLDLSFVAELDGKVIGFTMNRLSYMMIPLTEVCLIQGILVHPDHQARGIGSRLMDGLVEYCRMEHISTIRALVEQGNDELRRFIEHHGFRRSTITNWDKTFES